jgi:succinate dehydrogenase/fumarate reductase flavoprotein subunit
MMGYVGDPRAYWTAQGMARAAGVPLARAVVEGWITRDDLARIVERCRDCGECAACQRWLARLNPEVPGFCAIRPEIEALRALR